MMTLVPLLGICVFVSIAAACSIERRHIRLRTVLTALGLQFSVGAVVLFLPAGKAFVESVTSMLLVIVGYSQAGMDFVLGKLSVSTESLGYIFAFRVLPVLIFFSSLVAVLYHLGVIQPLIKAIGWLLQRILGTSQAESSSAAANLFFGGTEVYLLMRPYILTMTNSELFALMVGCSASMNAALVITYANMGVNATYLMAAIFMSAPGGLLIAKVMAPETARPNAITLGVSYEEDRPVNVVDAATRGAISGAHMAATIGVMLMALISLIAMVNGFLGYVGGFFGLPSISAQQILGYMLAPMAYLLGIPWSEAVNSGALLGTKLVLNEFVAYIDFSAQQTSMPAQTQMVMTIALAGFANLATPASLLGVLGLIVPERRPFIVRMALRVIVAGTLANLVSAAIASFLQSLFAVP